MEGRNERNKGRNDQRTGLSIEARVEQERVLLRPISVELFVSR